MERYRRRHSVHWKTLMLSIAVTAALTFSASGMEPEQSANQTSSTEQSTSDTSATEVEQLTKLFEDQTKMLMTALEQRKKLLEDQTKMLMTADAQRGFQEMFKTSFDPEKTRLLLGPDLKRWVQAHRPKVPLPERMKRAISANVGIGLLIQEGLPGSKGGQQDVVYMKASSFGGLSGLFLNEDPDPCGDGNLPCASSAPVAVERVVTARWVADRAEFALPVPRSTGLTRAGVLGR
jgi:hypothetical protein